ncbi:MAG: hypothetical protein EPO13_00815 [Actinomycetota bacterium]|nr:MAG: hypothetical protein EPO13_00815 [Actinomycetota bacterium]
MARDNGLGPASSWVALADVDPPLSDQVLAALRDAGVAAYVEPVPGVTGPYRDLRPPSRPTSRLYVDRAAADRARQVIEATLPGMRADFLADAAARTDRAAMEAAEVDAAWAAIVAGYADTAAPRTPRLPPDTAVPTDGEDPAAGAGPSVLDSPGSAGGPAGAAETRGGAPTDGASRPDGAADTGRARPGDGPPASGLSGRLIRRARPDGSSDLPSDQPGFASQPAADAGRTEAGPQAGSPDDDPGDHFVPPTPPPLPRGDTLTRLAWVGVLGGPLLLLVTYLLGWRLDRYLSALAVLGFVAGFVTLVARMRDDRGDDGPEDGAVV